MFRRLTCLIAFVLMMAGNLPAGRIKQAVKHPFILSIKIWAFAQGLAAGGSAGLLVDRNIRRQLGGIYAPFFGLEARTTPLPAWMALRYEVPMYPLFLFPKEDGRYRVWLGPDIMEGVEGEDHHARMRVALTRMNAVLEDIIRAQPGLWNWTLKRWKSRPTVELEGYPPYSIYDPDV